VCALKVSPLGPATLRKAASPSGVERARSVFPYPPRAADSTTRSLSGLFRVAVAVDARTVNAELFKDFKEPPLRF